MRGVGCGFRSGCGGMSDVLWEEWLWWEEVVW